MNTSKRSLLAIALALVALPCFAQNGFDYFHIPRETLVTPNKTMLYSGTGVGGYTNTAIVDLHTYVGVVVCDVFFQTNVNAGTMQVSLETSPDQATWTAVQNIAIATNTTVIYTNLYYGTNGLTATNTYALPGQIITPTASSAGWATPYTAPVAFTNSGLITILGGVTHLGFTADDQQRYFRINYLPGGTGTNASIAATLTGRLSVGYP